MSDALERLSRDRAQNRVMSQSEIEDSFRRGGEAIYAGALGAGNQALLGLPEWVVRRGIGDEAVEKWLEDHGSSYRTGEILGTIGSSLIPVGGLAGRGLNLAGKAVQGARTTGNLARLGRGLQATGNFLRGTSPAARTVLGRMGQGVIRGGIEGALESGTRAAFGGRDVLGEAAGGALFGGAAGGLSSGLGEAGKALTELRKATTRPAFLSNVGTTQRSLRQAFEGGQVGGQAFRAGNVDDYLDDFVSFLKKKNVRTADELDDVARAARDDLGRQFEQYNRLDVPKPKDIDVYESITKNKSLNDEMMQIGEADVVKAIDQLTPKITAAGTNTNQLGAAKKIMDRNRPGIPGRDEAQFFAARTIRDNIMDRMSKEAQKAGLRGYQDLGKEWGYNELLGRISKQGDLNIASLNTGSGTAEKTALQKIMGLGAPGGTAGIAALGSDWEDPANIPSNLLKIGLAGVGGAALTGASASARNALMSRLDDLLLAASKNKGLAKVLGGAPAFDKKGNPIMSLITEQQAMTPSIRNLVNVAGRAGFPALNRSDAANRASMTERDRESLAPSEPEQADQIGEAAADAQQTPEGRAEYNSLVQQKLYQRFVEMYPLYAEDDQAFSQFVAGAERASEGFDPRRTAKLLFPREDDRKAFLAAYQTQQTVGQTIPNIGVQTSGLFGRSPLTLEQQGARATLEGAFLEASKLANIEPRDARKILEQVLDSNLSAAEKRQAILNQTRAWNQIGFEKLQAVGLG